MRKWDKWKRTTTITTTRVVPWSLADGHRQKGSNFLCALRWSIPFLSVFNSNGIFSVTSFNFQKPKHFLIFHLENFRSSFQPGGGGGIIKSFIFRNSSKWPRSGTKKGLVDFSTFVSVSASAAFSLKPLYFELTASNSFNLMEGKNLFKKVFRSFCVFLSLFLSVVGGFSIDRIIFNWSTSQKKMIKLRSSTAHVVANSESFLLRPQQLIEWGIVQLIHR